MSAYTPPKPATAAKMKALLASLKLPEHVCGIGTGPQACYIFEGTADFLRPIVAIMPLELDGYPIVFRLKEEFWPLSRARIQLLLCVAATQPG